MKKLSTNKLLAILDRPCAVDFMCKYIVTESYKLNKAAYAKYLHHSSDPETKALVASLSLEEAEEIVENCGPIPEVVWIKILETFPKNISKNLLISYCGYGCHLHEETLVKAVQVLPKKDSREIILKTKTMTAGLLGQVLRAFGKPDAKKLLLELAKKPDAIFSADCELKILRVFSGDDLKDLLLALVHHFLEPEVEEKMFDLLPPKDVKKILKKAFAEDKYLGDTILVKIVENYSKRQAKALLNAYFATNVGQCEYTEDELQYIRKLLGEAFEEKAKEF